MLWMWFWGCLITSSQTTREEASDIDAVLSSLPPEEQELKALNLLRENPEQFEKICSYIRTENGKETCRTYESRPHLWTISSQDAPVWNGGYFFSRILFPRTHLPQVIANDAGCNGNSSCLFQKSIQLANTGKSEESKNICASITNERQQWECMFQVSEQIKPPQYDAAVEMCLLSGSFSPECHNHLILRLVQDAWLSPQKHERYRSQIESYWGKGEYTKMLLDVYWSALASRTLGVLQPFSLEDVPVQTEDFMVHLHSALALRVIFSSDPLSLAKKSKKETLHLDKAHGPNSPVFIPKRVWNADEEHAWVHFCDVRGGVRPTSSDPDEDLRLALMTAAMMTNPPKIDLIHQLSETGTPLVLWSKEKLLSGQK